MEAKTLASGAEQISVDKRDLIEAWSLLERIVISLRKIGSVHAIPQGQVEQTPQQRQQMLEALGEFFNAELWSDLSHARVVIAEYLPEEEAEAISDALSYWQQKKPA
jgi:hypothetical protein